MLLPSTLKFLKDLSRNNNRDWFEKNKPRYLNAKADFDAFVEKVISAFSVLNPELKNLQVKDSVFRIYRDVRFSKNKTPYKTSFSASIDAGGRKSPLAGFYFQVDPAGEWGSFLAGGLWQPEPPLLKAVRQEIEYNTEEFLSIIKDKKFKKIFGEPEGHKLSRLPKGVDKKDPNAELYKYTSFIVSRKMDEKDFQNPKIISKMKDDYKVMLPFLDFLNRAIR